MKNGPTLIKIEHLCSDIQRIDKSKSVLPQKPRHSVTRKTPGSSEERDGNESIVMFNQIV